MGARTDYNALKLWSGRVGGEVYRVVRGKQIVVPFVKPRNPNTDAQKLTRAKLALIAELGVLMRRGVDVGCCGYAKSRKSTAFGGFVHYNYHLVTGSTPEALTVDLSALTVARGTRTCPTFSSTIDVASVPNTVSVTVSDASTLYNNERTDNIYVLVYCPDGEGAVLSAPATRAAGKIEVPVPAAWSGLDVHVWGWACAANKSGTSNSDYLGHATLN